MYLRYLGSSLFIVVILTTILTFKNYKSLYKYRDFSYPLETKIALIFEAVLDTRSDIYRIFDNFYESDNDNLKKIYLNVNRGDLEKARNQWVQKALLGDPTKNDYFSSNIKLVSKDDIFQKSKFRFRGRSDWHLRLDKPSLRIKLKNFETYNMMKHLNFTFPEGRGVIENYYADLVSKKIGLIAHHSELIELYINNVNYGVYHLHSREDESLIRINKRMPSPLLLGQNLNIDKWDFKDFEVVNSKSITRNHDIFKKMIDEINKPKNNQKDWEKIWEVINYEQTAKFIALNTILGIIHNDYWHNHEFFYDRTLGKIEPIVSDAQSLGTYVYPWNKDRLSSNTFFSKEKPDHTIPINQKTNPFFNSIIADTNFYHKKNQIIDNLINNQLSYNNQSKILEDIYNKIDNSVYRDKEKRYLIERINGWQIAKSSNYEYEIFKKNIFEYVKNRNLFIKNQLNQNSLKYSFINLKEFQNQKFLKIEYKGELPLNLKKSIFGNIKIYDPNKKKFVSYNSEFINFHTGLKIVKNNNKFTNKKLGNDIFHDHHYQTSYQTYLIQLSNEFDYDKFNSSLNKIKRVKSKNIIVGEQLSIDDIKYNTSTLHIWSNNIDLPENLEFKKGDHDIKEDIIVNKNQKLILKEGANLYLWPNVSIYSEGQVLIDGKNEGVTIRNKYPNEPWGNFSVFGKNSSGSFIKNATIQGGSTKDIKNILFSGMINFFWNKDILLENLIINNNSVGDDTIHFNKSKGKIVNLNIYDCLSDCIDMDYSTYTIKNLNCSNSLNDGLDLMESTVKGFNLNFLENMDKSISVGEASKLTVKKLIISNSNIGVASKDDSKVDLSNITIKNSNIGLDSYRKNSRYGSSGKINIKNKNFTNNKLDLRFSDKSKILFNYKDLNFIKN
jgi:hypothetical protein